VEAIGSKNVSSGGRYGGLDGLRAIAIILVLLFHLTPERNSDNGLYSIVFKIAGIGYVGVDLFFVLSGFLITSILLRYRREGKPLRIYFYRRLLRIVPLYYTVLVFVVFIVPLLSNIYRYPLVAEQLPYWLYVSNYIPMDTELSKTFSLSHFWSLAVEMQYYMVWPILMIFVPKARVVNYIIAFLMFVFFLRSWLVFNDVYWQVTFMWTPMRIDGLLIGSLIAILRDREGDVMHSSRRFLVICAVPLGILIASVAWYHQAGAIFRSPESVSFFLVRVGLPLLVSIFFGLLLVLALEDSAFTRVLSSRVFVFIAKYSYGIYVLHFLLSPIFLSFFLPPMKSYFGETDAAIYSYFLVTSGITLMLSIASYHALENRFLQIKKRL